MAAGWMNDIAVGFEILNLKVMWYLLATVMNQIPIFKEKIMGEVFVVPIYLITLPYNNILTIVSRLGRCSYRYFN